MISDPRLKYSEGGLSVTIEADLLDALLMDSEELATQEGNVWWWTEELKGFK